MRSVFFARDQMCTTLKLELTRVQDFFLANGWTVAAAPDEADWIICSVCVGWDSLEKDSLAMLRQHSRFGRRVVAFGCVDGLDPETRKGLSETLVIPSFDIGKVSELIPDAAVPFPKVPSASTFRVKEDYRLYDLSKRFVNVGLGCAFTCRYCKHKAGIGPRQSRPIEDILVQIRALMQEDVGTIVLTGLETGMYGREMGTSMAELMDAVLQVGESFEIRLAQFHPSGIINFEDDFLRLFSNSRITDVQIPIQSISPRLLKLMGRPAIPDTLGKLLADTAQANPGIVLRTDLIIGHPGETMEELQDSLDFATAHFDEISAYRFETVHAASARDLEDIALPASEVARRWDYSLSFIAQRGRLGHCGSQKTLDLDALEKQRQAQRAGKAAAQQIVGLPRSKT